MGWLSARGGSVVFAALSALFLHLPLEAATGNGAVLTASRTETNARRSAPTRPAKVWSFTKLRGTDYVADDIAGALIEAKVEQARARADVRDGGVSASA